MYIYFIFYVDTVYFRFNTYYYLLYFDNSFTFLIVTCKIQN